MRIAIDVEPISKEYKTGVPWYTYHLIHNLAKIDNENSYLLYHFKFRNSDKEYKKLKLQLPSQKNFRIRVKRIHHKLVHARTARFLPPEFLIGLNDIIHIPHPSFIPPSFTAKVIVTIHDLIGLMPGLDAIKHKRRKISDLKDSILRADRIITVSEHTRNDILKYFSVQPSKIRMVPLAADVIFHPAGNPEHEKKVLTRYGISKKYILYVGAIRPRKNLARALASFEIAKKYFNEYMLVVAGEKQTENPEFFQKLGRLPQYIAKDVVLTGYVQRQDLPYLYEGVPKNWTVLIGGL